MPYCHTPPQPDTCGLCQKYVTDANFRAFIDTVPPPQNVVPIEPKSCTFSGEELTGNERQAKGLDSKRWLHCLHPKQPIGPIVCPCKGCGPKCRGYKAEGGFFDRVVVINLLRRKDRLQTFQQNKLEHGWQLPELTIVEAIDGSRTWPKHGYLAGGGAWGCRCSHVQALEKALTDGVGTVLVLEDDAQWVQDSWSRLETFLENVPSDWDQIMLGGQHIQPPSMVENKPGVVQCTNCQRTHAYAIRGEAMRSLLHLWYNCTGHIDHAMGPWQRGYKVYAPDPFIFGQAGGQSDISGKNDPPRHWGDPPVRSYSRTHVIKLVCDRPIMEELRHSGLHTGNHRGHTGLDLGLEEIKLLGSELRCHRLQAWIKLVSDEASTMPGGVATLWHDSYSLEDIQLASGGRQVVQVEGNSVTAILTQLKELLV